MSKKQNNFRSFLKEKGYYLALGCMALAVAVAGLVYYGADAREDRPVDVVDTTAPSLLEQGDTDPRLAIDVIGTTPTAPAPTETTQPSQSLETMWPVEGEVVAVFAADKLTYNQTTKDWRVHHGVDLEAGEGTQVRAAAAGEVYTVYEDEIMGTTVVLRHTGGYVTTYASLSPEVSVAVGDKVDMGEVLGTVGNTALTEKALGPHVHFAVTRNGQQVDPAVFVEGMD